MTCKYFDSGWCYAPEGALAKGFREFYRLGEYEE